MVVYLNKRYAQRVIKLCPDIVDILQFALHAYCNSYFDSSVSVHTNCADGGKLSYLVRVCCEEEHVDLFAKKLSHFCYNALHDYLCQCDVPRYLVQKLRVTVV